MMPKEMQAVPLLQILLQIRPANQQRSGIVWASSRHIRQEATLSHALLLGIPKSRLTC